MYLRSISLLSNKHYNIKTVKVCVGTQISTITKSTFARRCTCILLTSAVMIQTFKIPVTDTATTVSSISEWRSVSQSYCPLGNRTNTLPGSVRMGSTGDISTCNDVPE